MKKWRNNVNYLKKQKVVEENKTMEISFNYFEYIYTN